MKTKILMVLMIGIATPFALANHHGHTPPKKNIVEIVTAPPTFNTLAAAVTAAGLLETIKGEGPFTIFAPTDEAFAALPEGTIATLLKPENKEMLVAILTFHVVAGNVTSADVAPGEVPTVNGKHLTVSIKDGQVMINNATVIAKDLQGSNGVIHVIDTVLLP